MRTLWAFVFVGLMATPVFSRAVLWDQSDFDPTVNALVDQEFGDFPTYSSYMVMDIHTGPGAWMFGGMTTFFTNAGGTFGGVTEGRLSIFHKTGSMPTAADNPVAQSVVPVRVTDRGDCYEIQSIGFSQWLAGDTEYWVGLTPIADFGVFGQEFHLASAPIIGADTAWRNPGGSFGVGASWQTVAAIDTTGAWVGHYDGAFRIDPPEPASFALLALGALALPRRR